MAALEIQVSDELSISDSLVAVQCSRPWFVPEVVRVWQTRRTRQASELALSDSVSVSDAAQVAHKTGISCSEVVTLSDQVKPTYGARAFLSDALSVADAVVQHVDAKLAVEDALALTESVEPCATLQVLLYDAVNIQEGLSVGSVPIFSDNTVVTVKFPQGLRLDGVSDVANYQIEPLDGGVPVMVLSATPIQSVLATLEGGVIVPTGNGVMSNLFNVGSEVVLAGDYISISTAWQQGTIARVLSVHSERAVLDANLLVADPQNGSITWQHLSAVTGVILTVNQPTNEKNYSFTATGLLVSCGSPFSEDMSQFQAVSTAPEILSTTFLPEFGTLLVTFSKDLSSDDTLLDPSSYGISGPTNVQITGLKTASPTQVLLQTNGFGTGTYQLSVAP